MFKGFKYIRVDDYGSNMLGMDNYWWIVTGFKPGKNLLSFNFLNYVGNIAKPK